MSPRYTYMQGLEESSEIYNKRVLNLIESNTFKDQNMILVDYGVKSMRGVQYLLKMEYLKAMLILN